jgi:hypothetical protein
MPKPGRRTNPPSDEIARFADREDQQALFQRYLNSAEEPPVLMFFGVGGAGKTWLLKKLRTQVLGGIPSAYLDFDTDRRGKRYLLDPTAALQSIQQQLGVPTPRFDLALAMLRKKQGHAAEPNLWTDIAAELVGCLVPGGGAVLKRLSQPSLA